jgi:hypothetical protein
MGGTSVLVANTITSPMSKWRPPIGRKGIRDNVAYNAHGRVENVVPNGCMQNVICTQFDANGIYNSGYNIRSLSTNLKISHTLNAVNP